MNTTVDPVYLKTWGSLRSSTNTVTLMILSPIIAFLGLLGNGLSMYVFTREKSKSSANFLLKALAFVDSMYLIWFVMSRTVVQILKTGYFPQPAFYGTVLEALWYIKFFRVWFHYTCTWTISLVTVDRFLHIYKPLVMLRLNPINYVKFAFFMINLGSIANTSIEHFYSYVVFDPDKNDIRFVFLGIEQDVLWWNLQTSTIFTMVGVPVYCITIPFNIANYFLLRRRRRMREESQDAVKKDSSTTILVAVSALNAILHIPLTLRLLIWAFANETNSNFVTILHYVGNLGILTNSACNFVVYFVVGAHFRRKLRQLFCGVKSVKQKDETAMSDVQSK